MYNSIMLTLIFAVLLWIAIGLQVIASSVRILGRVMPTRRKIQALERNTMPWLAKMVVVKVASHFAIRYIGKKFR